MLVRKYLSALRLRVFAVKLKNFIYQKSCFQTLNTEPGKHSLKITVHKIFKANFLSLLLQADVMQVHHELYDLRGAAAAGNPFDNEHLSLNVAAQPQHAELVSRLHSQLKEAVDSWY